MMRGSVTHARTHKQLWKLAFLAQDDNPCNPCLRQPLFGPSSHRSTRVTTRSSTITIILHIFTFKFDSPILFFHLSNFTIIMKADGYKTSQFIDYHQRGRGTVTVINSWEINMIYALLNKKMFEVNEKLLDKNSIKQDTSLQVPRRQDVEAMENDFYQPSLRLHRHCLERQHRQVDWMPEEESIWSDLVEQLRLKVQCLMVENKEKPLLS